MHRTNQQVQNDAVRLRRKACFALKISLLYENLIHYNILCPLCQCDFVAFSVFSMLNPVLFCIQVVYYCREITMFNIRNRPLFVIVVLSVYTNCTSVVLCKATKKEDDVKISLNYGMKYAIIWLDLFNKMLCKNTTACKDAGCLYKVNDIYLF